MFAITKIAPVALAAIMTAATLVPADASQRTRARNAGIIGAAVGALGAAAIIGSRRRARPVYVAPPQPVYVAPRRVYRAPRPVYRGGGWAGHVARCYAAYRSYDERTDTYVAYSGQVRRCTK